MRMLPLCLSITMAVSACAPAPRTADAGAPPADARAVKRGKAFAAAHCAACHAIGHNGVSANPESPPFEAVVNVPDLTRATLTAFLRDSHNFPAMMTFAIAPAQIDDLAAYMITLRRDDYRPLAE